MKTLRKGILYAVALVLMALALGLLGVNFYLRAPERRTLVEATLRQRFGMPVTYGALSYLPWRGLRMSSVRVPHDDEVMHVTGEPWFSASAIVGDVALWSLLEGAFHVGEVKVVDPVWVTVQRADGSLAWPRGRDAEAGGEVAFAEAVGEVGAVPRGVETAWKDVVMSGAVTVQGGRAVLWGEAGKRALIDVEGIGATMRLPLLFEWWDRGLGGELGSFFVQRATFLSGVELSEVRSPIRLRNDGTLALSLVEAECDGGTVSGGFLVDVRRDGVPFDLTLAGEAIEVRRLARRWAAWGLFSRGTLEGRLAVHGLLREAETWVGEGACQATGAALAQNSLLESFGRYVGLKEFVELVFAESRTQFRIADRSLHIDEILWKTDNLEFRGVGRLGFDQQVKFAARLFYSKRVKEILQRIERQLPERVVRKPTQFGGREDYYRDFEIVGRLGALRADFLGEKPRSLREIYQVLESRRAAEAAREP